MRKRMICFIMSIILTMGVMVGIDTNEVYAISQNDVVSQLNSLASQYNGKTATSNQLYLGIQCKGFANWVFLKLFGVYIGPYSSSANYKIPNPNAQTIGILEPGNLNVNTAKELLKKGAPGDFIQVQRSTARGRGPHSMILMGVNDNGIEVLDCNSDGKDTIKKQSISWTSFDTANRAMSLYRGNGYAPSSNSSAGSSSSGNSSAGKNEPFRCSIDFAPADGEIFRNSGDSFSMGGWALTTYGNGNGVTCINVVVNGKDVLPCSRSQRDDVANVFPNYANRNAGFSVNVPVSLLNPGRNTVALRAYATNNNWNDILIGDFGERSIYYEPAVSSLEGYVDLASGKKGAVVVAGWVYDRNSDGPIDLHVYIGGKAGEPGVPGYVIRADKKREDVASVCGVGMNHGFADTIYTDCVGEKELYFYAVNGNSNKFIGTKTVNIQKNREPVGCIDIVKSEPDIIRYAGWSYDPDNIEMPVWMHIYLDGPAGSGKFIGSTCADHVREDVAKVEHISNSRHGFSGEIEIPNLTGTHTLYFYAIDLEGGNNPLLGSRTIECKQGKSPVGVVDFVKGGKGTVQVGGWTYDPDVISKSLAVHVYVGGPAGSGAPLYEIKADRKREDLKISSDERDLFHGYNEVINTSQRGETEVYVYAVDEGSRQSNPLLGHKTVIIEEKETEKEHTHEYTETIIKEATCTEQGNKQYNCSICGECFIKITDKIPHTVMQDEGRDATCETDGYTEGSHCSACGTIITPQEIIEKSGHKDTVIKYQKDPTCVSAGYTGDVYCRDCGAKVEEGTYTKQLEHTVGEEIVLKAPTESEAGINIFICVVCQTMGVKIIPAKGAEKLKAEENHVHEYVGETIKVPAYYAKLEEEKRVEACACGEYVVETVSNLHENQFVTSEEDQSADQNSEKKEPERKTDQTEITKNANNAVLEENKTYRSGKFYYKVTKFTENENGGTVELKGPVVKTMTSVNIPAAVMIEGSTFQVTGIGKNAFKNNKDLKKVTIGANVTRIETNAFRGCSKLKKLKVKSGKLESIGKNVFKGISKIKVSVPKKNRKAYEKLFKDKMNVDLSVY